MLIYILNILITLLVGLYSEQHTEIILKEKRKKVSWLAIVLILFSWTIVYAFRGYHVGSDTYGYMYFYARTYRYHNIVDCMSDGRDFLYQALLYLCFHLFSGKWIPFAVVCGVLTYAPVLWILREESEEFTFSALLYIFTLNYYFGFNGIRQGIAMSMTYLAYVLLYKKRNWVSSIIIAFIAYGFHSTVLLIMPFFLLSMRKLNSLSTKIIIAALLIGFISLGNIWSNVIEFLDGIGQTKLAHDFFTLSYNGSGYLRIVVGVIPVILGIYYYKKLKRTSNNIDREIILMLFYVVFMIFSTKNWIFSRMSVYFMLAVALFVPKLNVIFKDNSKIAGRILIGILYFAYMVAIILHGESSLYPYTFYWS